MQHPSIVPPIRKEVHFFDQIYSKGPSSRILEIFKEINPFYKYYKNLDLNAYRANFPLLIIKYFFKYILKRKFITGEASASYIYNPQVPQRVAKTIPKIKLILLLRDPVNRLLSHYNSKLRILIKNKRGVRVQSFEKVIQKAEESLSDIRELYNGENISNLHKFPYYLLLRGIYVDQIINWHKYFPPKQIMIIRSEDFFENPQKILGQIFRFLDLTPIKLKEYKKYHEGNYKNMNEETRKLLRTFFKPHNQRLYDYLNRNFYWS